MASQERRIPDLLLKAVKSLPEEERDEVLRELIGRTHLHVPAADPTGVLPGPSFDPAKPMSQPLLIRLPPDLHDRLRTWSVSHGFSMAAVARGLIERFLDDQEHSRQ
ncbi:MAG: hypothetical protein ACXWEJ_09510 [Actinomycetota bacterium]